MIRTAFYEPSEQTTVEREIGPDWDILDLVQTVLGLSSGRGHPAAQLLREDGSTVSLGTDGERAALAWTDSLGGSFHSVGTLGGTELVFDYFGSWSDAPADSQIPLADALDCMKQFVVIGSPVTDRVMFEPD